MAVASLTLAGENRRVNDEQEYSPKEGFVKSRITEKVRRLASSRAAPSGRGALASNQRIGEMSMRMSNPNGALFGGRGCRESGKWMCGQASAARGPATARAKRTRIAATQVIADLVRTDQSRWSPWRPPSPFSMLWSNLMLIVDVPFAVTYLSNVSLMNSYTGIHTPSILANTATVYP